VTGHFCVSTYSHCDECARKRSGTRSFWCLHLDGASCRHGPQAPGHGATKVVWVGMRFERLSIDKQFFERSGKAAFQCSALFPRLVRRVLRSLAPGITRAFVPLLKMNQSWMRCWSTRGNDSRASRQFLIFSFTAIVVWVGVVSSVPYHCVANR
jgi:hypothetical protein